MKSFLCLIISIFISCSVNAQGIKEYVNTHTSEIKSIDLNYTDDADLEAFGNAIGDARVVMLGEQGHGDAPTYLAKTRLIKYLHEKEDFNVLAFESDFWSLNYGWNNLPKNDSAMIVNFLKRNIFGIWTYCQAFLPLLQRYIPATYKTKNPLKISGFDNQMMLGYSDKLTSHLDSVFKKYHLPIVQNKDYSTEVIPAIDSLRSGFFRKNNLDNPQKVFEYLDTIYYQLRKVLPQNSFDILLIKNLQAEADQYFRETDYNRKSNVRDKQMFENLKWLIQTKYPNEKIIVWAASEHVSKFVDGDKRKSMGGYFINDSSLLKETYVLGFTSYQGEAGRIGMKKYTLLKPWRNSFETWVNPQYEYSFTDFKPFENKSDRFRMQGRSHYYEPSRDWANIFDGIFFIRNMYSCLGD